MTEPCPYCCTDGLELEAEIRQLRAEIERLRAELAAAHDGWWKAADQAVKLRAENARLLAVYMADEGIEEARAELAAERAARIAVASPVRQEGEK